MNIFYRVSLLTLASALNTTTPVFNTTEPAPEANPQPQAFTFEIKKQFFKKPVTALHYKLKAFREEKRRQLEAQGIFKKTD
jgi:hypothetical protein